MATILARPAQTLRRREPVRPSLSTKRGASIDMTSDASLKKRKLNEPYVWDSQYILNKHKGKPPSIVVHLHKTNFRFDGHDSSYSYDGPMRTFIKHMRAQTIPHDFFEELLNSGIPWYDGRLIVEVHNHRDLESQNNGSNPSSKVDDTKKLSMHNWTAHVTPSPYEGYPDDAQIESDAQNARDAKEEADKNRAAGKDGPQITTLVLHPTAQTQHEEMLILARTPVPEIGKRKNPDGTIAGASTPQNTVPPTPTSAGPQQSSQKTYLTQQELYEFQGKMLVASMPPLYLEPAKDATEAFAIMKMLEDPLQSEKPPDSKECKRTTAEMAADDAQAAEVERRMLIFDERLGPSARSGAGAGNSDNQAAAMGFSRFKTIEMVKQKLAENERAKKEDEARQAQEKRQQEEQLQQQKAIAAQKKIQEANIQEQQRRQQLLYQRQQQQQEALAKMNGQQSQQGMMPNHGHGLQNGQNFQQTTAQASPVVAQQTPLMPHSSPMVAQNGFPMMSNMSQSAASPPRPPSAVPSGMVRGPSQQTHNSLNNTPHIAQNGTPSLANAVPNRSMSQTPRLNPSSPMTGTPAGNAMQTPRMNGNLNTTQDIMLQQMQNLQANAGMQNAGQNANGATLNSDDVQFARTMARYQELALGFRQQAAAAHSQGNTAMVGQFMQRANAARQQYDNMRVQLQARGSMAMSPGQGAQTPQVGHGHPKQMQNGQMGQNGFNQQQQQNMQAHQAQMLAQQQQQQQQQAALLAQRQAQQRAQQQQMMLANQQLNNLLQAHGGTIPQHIIPTLPQAIQTLLRQRQARQMQMRQQAQGMQMNGQGSPQNGQQGYMQNLQQLRMQMQQGQQAGNPNMNAMAMSMGNVQQFAQQQQQQQRQQQALRQQQQQQQQGTGDLSQSFAEMQAALQRGNGQ